MTKNLKELVKTIEKLAQAAPPPPPGALLDPGMGPFGGGGGFGGHGGTDQGGGGGGAGGGGGGSTAIMAMQHALQDLAADVSKQINLQQMVNPDPNNPRAQEEARSRDAFGTFITKNYMRNSAVSGVEYDPNPKVRKVPDKQKSATDPTRLSVVMDTMNRIGKERGEAFVDGNWGPRTNAAIRNAYALAQGLFKFVDDVNTYATNKLQVQSYSKDSLRNLEGMATVDNSLSPEDKATAAPLITQHVKAIHAMYDEVKNKVLEHKAYRQFIESDKQYKTYSAGGLTPQQIKVLTDAFPQGFPIQVGNARANVDIGSLTSVDKLNQWITAHPQLGKLTPQTIADQIQRQHGHTGSPAEPYQGILTQKPSTDPGY
jgi:hypothetical protein